MKTLVLSLVGLVVFGVAPSAYSRDGHHEGRRGEVIVIRDEGHRRDHHERHHHDRRGPEVVIIERGGHRDRDHWDQDRRRKSSKVIVIERNGHRDHHNHRGDR